MGNAHNAECAVAPEVFGVTCPLAEDGIVRCASFVFSCLAQWRGGSGVTGIWLNDDLTELIELIELI